MVAVKAIRWSALILVCIVAGSMCADDTLDIIARVQQGQAVAVSVLPGIHNLDLPRELKSFLSQLELQASLCTVHNDGTMRATTAGVWAGITVPVTCGVTCDNQTSIEIALPNGVSVTHFFPELKKLSLFACKNTHVIVSTCDDKDNYAAGMRVRGANLAGTLVLSGPLMYAAWMVGQDWLEVPFFAQLRPMVSETSVTLALPGSMQFWGGVNASQAVLSLGGQEQDDGHISYGTIAANMNVDWAGQAPLVCDARIDLGVTQATIVGSCTGTINNIFGIYGVHARNGELGGTVDYKEFSTTTGRIPLKDLFLKFDFLFADKTVQMMSYIDGAVMGGSPRVALEGSFSGDISLQDCVDFVGDALEACPLVPEGFVDYQNALRNMVPDMVIHNAHLTFSPQDMQFDGKSFAKGLVIQGDAEFFGVGAQLYVQAQERGLKIAGDLDEITFGPVTITGAGRDGVDGTADDGVIIDAELGLDRQYCTLTGRVDVNLFGGISNKIDIDLSRTGFSFATTKKIADLFACELLFKGSLDENSHITALHVKGNMQQEALNKLQALLSQMATRVAKARLRAAVKTSFNWQEMFTHCGRALVAIYNNFWAFLASVVGNTFNITECTFEGEFNELSATSELKHVCLKGTLLGKAFELRDISFDLTSPKASAQTIVELVLHMFE